MRIIGVGTDLCSVARFRAMDQAELKGMARKILSKEELESPRSSDPEYLASRFAAKEAAAKSLGTGFSGFLPSDLTVAHDHLGKPNLECSDRVRAVMDRCGADRIEISVSHEKDMAVAFAVAVGE